MMIRVETMICCLAILLGAGVLAADEKQAATTIADDAKALRGSWERAVKTKAGGTAKHKLLFSEKIMRIEITWENPGEKGEFGVGGNYALEEKEGKRVIVMKGKERSSSVGYKLDGDKLVLKGESPDFRGYKAAVRDLTGEWSRVKEKKKP
jgi:hypothetical protein